jgi:hypothetical protein
MQLEDLSKKLDTVIAALIRIEERQIKTTAMVEHVKETERPVEGSFGSSQLG